MLGRIVAAIIGLAVGAIATMHYEVDGGTCYCYEYEGNKAKWTDNCPPDVVGKPQNQSRCPDSID